MKKALSLLLAILMLASVFTGCGKSEDKGPIIPVYITDEIVNFDPAFAYDDDAAAKILPLLFEGLTVIDEKGKVEYGMMEDYTYEQQEDGTYMMEITLKESYWSDAGTVSADDFVYAFKRIMDPEFDSQSAALLYELQNAREVKAGDKSIDDLGVRSAEKTVLQFIFDHDIDMDAWLETLASPALVPLRETAVSTQDPQDRVYITETDGDGKPIQKIEQYDIPEYAWSTDPQTLITNGKFTVKKYSLAERNENGELVLERNSYYQRDPYGDDAVTKYVKVNQLKIVYLSRSAKSDYELGEGESEVALDQLCALATLGAEDKTQSIVFDSDLSLVPDSKVSKETTVDMLTQHVYYFNTANELFADANVRKALSMAIDREAITAIVRNSTASAGWVPAGVFKDSARKADYRDSYEALISANANVDEAKKLLKSAGVTKGKFELTCRDSAVESAIAEYVAEVWEDLGFDVEVKTLSVNNTGIQATEQTKYYSLYRDEFTNALIAGEFDVIALDYTSMSTYAFASLAPFANGFTGRAISLKEKTLNADYDATVPHITGWENAEYDKLIAQAFEEKDLGARSDILYQAEQILMEQMPVMPLIQYKNSYIKTGALSGISTTYYGAVDFGDAKLKSAEDYIAPETSETVVSE